MRRAGLVVVALVAAACGGHASGESSGAWIGSSSVRLSSASVVYGLGLDGSVRRARSARFGPPPSRGATDRTGRYVAVWQQGGQDRLVLHGKGGTRTIANQVGTEAAWRPDGGALAFGQLVSEAVRLRIAEADRGFRIRQLGIALCRGGMPAWSPDGRLLALASPNDQRHCERGAALLVVDARDGRILGRQAIDNPVPATPAWSSDGSYASEDATVGTSGIALVSRSPQLGSSRTIADCSQASWSPRGARFAASCGGQLAIVDARSGKRVDLAPSDLSPGQAPVWSNDGSRLAATTAGGFVVATASGRTTRVRIGGSWAGGVLGFSRGRAIVEVSTAPPGD